MQQVTSTYKRFSGEQLRPRSSYR